VTIPLSVVVITKDEERTIERCLRSVDWAAERVVVDAMSEDRTTEVATRMGACVISRSWPGYGPQKNYGVSMTRENWILNLDADEVATPELAAEIGAELAAPRFDAYRLLVPTYFLGKPLRHYGRAGVDPGHIRLFRKDRARFSERAVHEVVEVRGTVGELRSPLLHYSYPTLGSYWKKIHRYASLEAQVRRSEGVPRGGPLFRAVGKAGWMLLWRRGIAHGPAACLWIAGQAYQEWLTTVEASRLIRHRVEHANP